MRKMLKSIGCVMSLILCFQLNINAQPIPPNDECINATMVYGDNSGMAVLPVDLTQATLNPTYEGCDNGMQPGIWYKFTASTGNIVVMTTPPGGVCPAPGGSDTELLVATGDDCDNLTILQCDDNDNHCGSSGNEIYTGSVGAGTTVYVMVRRQGDGKDLVYDLSIEGAAPLNAIPTLSEWGFILLLLSFMIIGMTILNQVAFTKKKTVPDYY